MVVISRFLLCCVLLISSCGSTMATSNGCSMYWNEHSFPIKVAVDNTFDIRERASTVMALMRWNHAVGKTVFVFSPRPLNNIEEGISLTHKKLPGTYVGLCPAFFYANEEGLNGRIWRGTCALDNTKMDPLLFPEGYIRVIVHELGHALGFPHTINRPETYMNPSVSFIPKDKLVFTEDEITTLRNMMHGTYKRKTIGGKTTCL